MYNHWTPGEQNTLKNLWPNAPRETILKGLSGRNWGAIRHQAMRLELAPRPNRFIFPSSITLQPTEASYLAGIVDGEGSIGLFLRHGVICPTLIIANTNRKLVEWCRSKVGGSLSERARPPWKTIVHLSISRTADVERLLIFLLPYMVAKRDQADLMLAYIEHHKRRFCERPDQTELDFMEALHRLNKRGLNP